MEKTLLNAVKIMMISIVPIVNKTNAIHVLGGSKMRVEFDLPELTLRRCIDVINSYLEECEAPTIHCQWLDEEETEEMKDLELALAAAQVGNAIHKCVLKQTNDNRYLYQYKKQLEGEI